MVFMHWQKVSLPFKLWSCSVCGVLPWILQDMEGWALSTSGLRNASAFADIWLDIQHHLVWDASLFAGEGLVAVPLSFYCTQFSHGILKAFRFKISNMHNSSYQPSAVLIIICQNITIFFILAQYKWSVLQKIHNEYLVQQRCIRLRKLHLPNMWFLR